MIRNVGRSAATGTRVVITDFYELTENGGIEPLDIPQKRLPGGGDLPAGLVSRLLLLERIRINAVDSGFIFGHPLAVAVHASDIGPLRVGFTPSNPDLRNFGHYILRIVTSASNVRAKTHFMMAGLHDNDLIKL